MALTRTLPALLDEPSRLAWLHIARSPELTAHWMPGRQGTGYEKLDLVAALRDGVIEDHRTFIEDGITAARAALGVDSSRGWDAYLLRYRGGAFVPEHRDPTTELCHLRLNVLLLEASKGTGVLRLAGQAWEGSAGDGVLFRPDAVPHEVSRVEGERFVLSVGCVFERETPEEPHPSPGT